VAEAGRRGGLASRRVAMLFRAMQETNKKLLFDALLPHQVDLASANIEIQGKELKVSTVRPEGKGYFYSAVSLPLVGRFSLPAH
jgi:hypothetical protein